MKTKLIWLIAALVVATFLIWFFWPSITGLTCKAKCRSLGYTMGICRSGPILQNVTKCEANETNIEETIDCTPTRKVGRLIIGAEVGAWKNCCCRY